jgi:hypothetical protein
LIQEYNDGFVFEEIKKDNGKDVFELETVAGKVVVQGNNSTSMANYNVRGLNGKSLRKPISGE